MAIEQKLVDTFDLQAIYFDIRNRMASLYQKPATGIPASDLAEGVIPDISGKADKTDTVLLTSLTRGRIESQTIGDGSIGFGNWVIASGPQAQAFGSGTRASGDQAAAFGAGSQATGSQAFAAGGGAIASGNQAVAFGGGTTASGNNAFASGGGSKAFGPYSHAEGSGGIANGNTAHVEGISNIGNGKASHVGGMFNVADSYLAWEEWTADTLYEVGRKVKIGVSEDNEIVYYGYICNTQNQDHEFDSSKWDLDYKMNFARIIGNGADYNHRSNALALGWDGNLYLMGDVYVGCGADSTDGVRLAKITELPIYDTATSSRLGLVKVNSSNGIKIASGTLSIYTADDGQIKGGISTVRPITPSNQDKSVFYGLSKVAGADLTSATVTVGIYPDSSKQAIQKMFGFDNLLGPYEMDSVADQAYALNELFIFNGKLYKATAAIAVNDVIAPGTNCDSVTAKDVFVKKTDYATDQEFGIVKVGSGLQAANGVIKTLGAGDGTIKQGTSQYYPIVPQYQQYSVFYGLSKAAGINLANETVTFGQYPQSSKTAIQTMLGIEANIPLVETVTGATVSITGMPNVRYICETAISELTITPPASGSIVVRFTAGSNCIVVLPNTVKLPEWFDISSLEAGTTYEIIITDGVYGGVMSWAA